MLTLKLYQANTADPMSSRTIIIECVGVWVDHCDNGVKHLRAFQKTVGVMDDGGTPEFYVGGTPKPEQDAINTGHYGNHFAWAVIENALGKTTEMLR